MWNLNQAYKVKDSQKQISGISCVIKEQSELWSRRLWFNGLGLINMSRYITIRGDEDTFILWNTSYVQRLSILIPITARISKKVYPALEKDILLAKIISKVFISISW